MSENGLAHVGLFSTLFFQESFPRICTSFFLGRFLMVFPSMGFCRFSHFFWFQFLFSFLFAFRFIFLYILVLDLFFLYFFILSRDFFQIFVYIFSTS